MANEIPKDFKFFLTDEAGDFIELLNAPTQWQSAIVEYKRSDKYQGVIRSLTLPFTFPFKGAGMLRQAWYNDGVGALRKILVQKINPSTRQYPNIFQGKVDFTQIEDDEADVTVNVVEDSFTEKVSAFEDVPYDIPLDVADAIDIELTPIPFKERAEFIFTPLGEVTRPGFPGLEIITNEVHATVESVQDVEFQIQTSYPDFSTSNKWFYTANADTNLAVTFTNVAGFTQMFASSTARFRICLVKEDGTIVATMFDRTSDSGVDAFIFSGSYSIPLTKGEKVFVFEIIDSSSDNTGFIISQGTMSLSYLTESPSSHCKALRASYVYDYLIQKMNGLGTGGAYTRQETSSELLTSTLYNLTITCSNSIRKIVNGTQYNPGDTLYVGAKYVVIGDDIIYNSITYHVNDEFVAIDGAETFSSSGNGSVLLIQYREVISLSFKDFHQSILSVMGGDSAFGMDNGIATYERRSAFFRNVVMIDLGTNTSKPKRKPALDYIYNSITCGYDDQQYDTLNGFQETNSTQTYTGDLTAYKKDLNLVSAIRADPIGIETLRFTPQDTSASRSDNDSFFIWIKDESEIGHPWYRPLRTEGLISITGMDNPETYYNWQLTPKRCLLRGQSFLRSVFDKQTTIRFIRSLKNANLVTVSLDGLRVAERDDILISNLEPPMFYPVLFELNVKLEEGALNSLNAQYGTVKFNYRNNNYQGYIIESSVDVGQNSTRTFTLLSTATNVLTNLIY